jgi:hypothetical protein
MRSIASGIRLPDAGRTQGRMSLLGGPAMGTEETALSNAVARLVLSSIQQNLPQSGVMQQDGGLILSRSDWPTPPGALTLWPRLLFEVNRADAVPGFTWPEAYHATHLPGFEIIVVTVALDSAALYGYSELAIGRYPAARSLNDGAREVIREWWTLPARTGQPCWAFLFDTGEVDEATAWSWAAEVWDVGTGEPRLGAARADEDFGRFVSGREMERRAGGTRQTKHGGPA